MADKRAGKAFDLGNYVEVKDRIIPFREQYPDGRIETEVLEITDVRVTVKAMLFDKRDSEVPFSTGHSWMNVPGKTPYTKDSEIENAETSAVGRALAFIGIGIEQSIASRDEVYGKVDDETEPPQEAAPIDPNAPTTNQKRRIRKLAEAIYGTKDKTEWQNELLNDYILGDMNEMDVHKADDIIKDLELRSA